MELCITFDYELFFGDNYGSYDDILFEPTYELINALEKNGISATFFADVCSIPIAKKYDQLSYVKGFEKQIQYMEKHGQDVQLHLHPHWYYSKWENGKWSFSNKGYRLHEFEDKRIVQIISEGVDYLNSVLRPILPKYKCIAFRAGGFSIQPHEIIVKALYDNGIRVDSSIAPQLVAKTEAQYYDYKHSIRKLNWYISEKEEWWEDCKEDSCLYEIPVATINKNPLDFTVKRIFKPSSVKLELGTKRGTYIPIHLENKSRLKTYYEYVTAYNAISMDAYTADYLYDQIRRLKKKSRGADQTVALIGHPKLVTGVYINNLLRFIELIANDKDYEFVSISEAYQKEKNRWS